MAFDLETLGETAGSFAPVPGGAVAGKYVGKLLGSLGGLFGGGPATAAGAFDGLHSSTVDAIDDSQVYQVDAAVYVRLAKQFSITVEEVAILMAVDATRWGISAQQCWDGYAAGTSTGLIGYAADFNNSGAGRITSGQPGPSGGAGIVQAVANYKGGAKFVTLKVKAATPSASVVQSVPVPTSMSVAQLDSFLGGAQGLVQQAAPQPTSATNGIFGDVVRGGLNGAVGGATDVLLKTPQGQAAEDKGAMDWLNRNGLKIAAGAVPVAGFVTWLAVKAFSKR